MSKGKDHSKATVGLLILDLFTTSSLEDKIMGSLGYALGILVSPDLDLNSGIPRGKALRAASPLFFVIWKLFWRPYSLLIPHRSMISHAPLLGTLIRVLYLTLPVAIFVLVSQGWESGWKLYVWIFSSRCFWTLVRSDVLHWAMDLDDPD